MPTELRNFLALSYDELEELNLKAKEQRSKRVAPHKVQEERLKYLTDEKRIKAVTVLFSDLEGPRRRAALSRKRQIRIRQYRRILPFATRRSAAEFHRHHRRGTARDGLPEREGPSGSCALAV